MRRLGFIAFVFAPYVLAGTGDPHQAGAIRCQVCAEPSCFGLPGSTGQPSGDSRGAAGCGEDGDTVDVLFVYTANARIEAGGVSGIDDAAEFAIDDINATLA